MEPPLKENPGCIERLTVLWQERPGTVIAMVAGVVALIFLLVAAILWFTHYRHPQPEFVDSKPLLRQHLVSRLWHQRYAYH